MEDDELFRGRVVLSVGDRTFETLWSTLLAGSGFFRRLARTSSASEPVRRLTLDRDPRGFYHVLELLRDPGYPFPLQLWASELVAYEVALEPSWPNVGPRAKDVCRTFQPNTESAETRICHVDESTSSADLLATEVGLVGRSSASSFLSPIRVWPLAKDSSSDYSLAASDRWQEIERKHPIWLRAAVEIVRNWTSAVFGTPHVARSFDLKLIYHRSEFRRCEHRAEWTARRPPDERDDASSGGIVDVWRVEADRDVRAIGTQLEFVVDSGLASGQAPKARENVERLLSETVVCVWTSEKTTQIALSEWFESTEEPGVERPESPFAWNRTGARFIRVDVPLETESSFSVRLSRRRHPKIEATNLLVRYRAAAWTVAKDATKEDTQ